MSETDMLHQSRFDHQAAPPQLERGDAAVDSWVRGQLATSYNMVLAETLPPEMLAMLSGLR